MPLDAAPFALPLPPNYSLANFNEWFDPLHADALALRTSYLFEYSPDYLQACVAEYVATGAHVTPLPPAWSELEFTDWMTALTAAATTVYYDQILSRTPPELQAAVKSRINYGAAPASPVTLGFLGPALPAAASLTRATAGWAFGSTGVLTSFANDVPRFTYSPSTLAVHGLLNEPAVTNNIRNASAAGVTPGTPGTGPTNWSVAASGAGLIRSLVGSGVEDGIAYVDIKFTGTATTGTLARINAFESGTQIPALPGQVWSSMMFVALVGGSLANVSVDNRLVSCNAGGTAIGASIVAPLVPTNAPLRTQRSTNTGTLVAAATAFVNSNVTLNIALNVPIDVTLRVGLPMLAQISSASSSIVTTTVAVARAADVLTVVQALAAGFWDVVLTRVSGTTTIAGVDLTSGAGYNAVIPADFSPLQSVKFQMSL